jgi:FlaG protein
MANVITAIGAAAPAVPAPVHVPSSASPSAFPVAGVLPVTPVPPIGTGGGGPPQRGQSLPAPAAPPGPQGDLIQLQAVVEGLNRFLRDSQRQMVFQYDMKSGKESVTIVNPATGEVIRQIPAAQVLSTAQNLQQAGILMPGLIIDESA